MKERRFVCTRCSICCRHEPGYVFLSMQDISAIARCLQISNKAVVDEYCVVVNLGFADRLSLRETPDHDCIMWSDGGCRIHTHRPVQCRTYPFWESNVTDDEAWARVVRECPGADVGRRYTSSEIAAALRDRAEHPPIAPSEVEPKRTGD